MVMENVHESKTPDSSMPLGVIAISGEPAIVINGLPDPSPEFLKDSAVRHLETETDAECSECFGYGELLVGRNVTKKFGNKYYTGEVTKFDLETKWYMVMYEDDDFEELEWKELQKILQPLDIRSPLTKWILKLAKMKRVEHKKNETKMKEKV